VLYIQRNTGLINCDRQTDSRLPQSSFNLFLNIVGKNRREIYLTGKWKLFTTFHSKALTVTDYEKRTLRNAMMLDSPAFSGLNIRSVTNGCMHEKKALGSQDIWLSKSRIRKIEVDCLWAQYRKMHAFRYTTAECPKPFTRNVSLQKKMSKRKVKGQAFATFSRDTRA